MRRRWEAVLRKGGIFTFSERIFFWSIDRFFARNGAEPESISKTKTPRLHQSAALEWPDPAMISGAMSALAESGQRHRQPAGSTRADAQSMVPTSELFRLPSRMMAASPKSVMRM